MNEGAELGEATTRCRCRYRSISIMSYSVADGQSRALKTLEET
jgi:hypothetical protein